MRRKYVVPEIKITKNKFKDIITFSFGLDVEDDLEPDMKKNHKQ